jgi:hypothetical protein
MSQCKYVSTSPDLIVEILKECRVLLMFCFLTCINQ